MNKKNWNEFLKTRKHFFSLTEELSHSLPDLKDIQQRFADSRSVGINSVGINSAGKNSAYTVETPVVYNTALDDITIEDEIRLILVADNPGRREQAAENRRYLVGPSGKIAQKFFKVNPSLKIDFRKNVIILNKTPIHSPRTIELKELCKLESKDSLYNALVESQRFMASLLIEFQEALECPVWITGYSEMRKGGIFETYTETIKVLYANKKELYDQVFIYRHFSMNQFTIDLKQQALQGESVSKTLKRIGTAYKKKILG
ncbi:MAG: hypothetical protein FWB73_06265 [Treponema sp.]|nr:hypothetical protein [Treponema sp.]